MIGNKNLVSEVGSTHLHTILKIIFYIFIVTHNREGVCITNY